MGKNSKAQQEGQDFGVEFANGVVWVTEKEAKELVCLVLKNMFKFPETEWHQKLRKLKAKYPTPADDGVWAVFLPEENPSIRVEYPDGHICTFASVDEVPEDLRVCVNQAIACPEDEVRVEYYGRHRGEWYRTLVISNFRRIPREKAGEIMIKMALEHCRHIRLRSLDEEQRAIAV